MSMTLCSVPAPYVWQKVANGVEVAADVVQTVYQTDQPIVLVVAMRNSGQSGTSVVGATVLPRVMIAVSDASGTGVPATAYGSSEARTGSPVGATIRSRSGNIVYRVYNLARLFDLSVGGSYNVNVIVAGAGVGTPRALGGISMTLIDAPSSTRYSPAGD